MTREQTFGFGKPGNTDTKSIINSEEECEIIAIFE
jgi:hypothetical protein